jgi:hypothetical protein
MKDLPKPHRRLIGGGIGALLGGLIGAEWQVSITWQSDRLTNRSSRER